MELKEQSILPRPAKPELTEWLQFARYLGQAAEGFCGIMLGFQSESIIASAFIDSGHSLFHENVLFAEVDNEIVGMSSTFTEEQNRTFSDEPLSRASKRNATE